MEKDVNDEKQKMISEKHNFVCKHCESLSFQIVQLKKSFRKTWERTTWIGRCSYHQRYSNEKSGLVYSKFSKSSSNQTIFVKASEQSTKDKVTKAKVVHHYPKRKRFAKKKSYVRRYKSNFVPTCLYCGISGYTPNACYVRNFSIASGHYVWINKGTNYEGPEQFGYLKKLNLFCRYAWKPHQIFGILIVVVPSIWREIFSNFQI
jgi:hypothetical protein